MTTLSACAMYDRVALVHDSTDQTTISEMTAAEADLLIEQLQIALRQVLRVMRASGVEQNV